MIGDRRLTERMDQLTGFVRERTCLLEYSFWVGLFWPVAGLWFVICIGMGPQARNHGAQILRASNTIRALAFSPNGAILASGGDSHTIAVWDVSTGRLHATLAGHTLGIRALAFSDDGKYLASAGAEETIQMSELLIWDMERLELVGSHSEYAETWSKLQWQVNEGVVAAIDQGGKLSFFEGTTAAPLGKLIVQADAIALALAPDGQRCAAAGELGEISILNLRSSPRMNRVLGSAHHRVWSLTFGPNGKHLASADDTDLPVKVWDTSTGYLRSSWRTPVGPVRALTFSPDGRYFSLASGIYTQAGEVLLWESASRNSYSSLVGHQKGVYAIAFSPNGETLASGSGDETVKLWDLESRQEIMTLRQP